jgi:hypothetical protein
VFKRLAIIAKKCSTRSKFSYKILGVRLRRREIHGHRSARL